MKDRKEGKKKDEGRKQGCKNREGRKKGIQIEIKEANKVTQMERRDEGKRDRKKEGYSRDRKNPNKGGRV